MRKILIVEDETSLIGALKMKLESEGFEVLEAGNGEEGLEMALEQKPDLILLDIIMPVMDGITMLKKLRDDENGKDMKVIMLTNLSDDEKMEESMTSGSTDYLIKSDWKIEDVVGKVKERLA